MPDYPHFTASSVFPASLRNAAFMQLLLATRQWQVISRALLQSTPPDVRNEQFLHLMLLGAGAAKEASDAFVECDRLHWFESIGFPELPKVSDPLSLARKECDRTEPTSLYERLVEPLRNQVSFHWSRSHLEQGLSNLATHEFPVATGDTTIFGTTIPLAQALAAEVLGIEGVALQDLPELFERLVNLQDALRHLASFAFGVSVKKVLDQRPG